MRAGPACRAEPSSAPVFGAGPYDVRSLTVAALIEQSPWVVLTGFARVI